MRLKNYIDYKRFPEPYRGHKGRFTILVLSARKWLSGIWEPFFVHFCRAVVAPNLWRCGEMCLSSHRHIYLHEDGSTYQRFLVQQAETGFEATRVCEKGEFLFAPERRYDLYHQHSGQ